MPDITFGSAMNHPVTVNLDQNTTTPVNPANTTGIISEAQDTGNLKKLQNKITLVFHAVRFPDLTMPHKPEMFGIEEEDFSAKAMSLGRMKLFPDEVLKELYGEVKDSPIHKLRLIRSRLQSYVDQYTFSFMHGMSRAIPNEKLKQFRKIVNDLREEFTSAFAEYENDYDSMINASIKYWKGKADIYQISEEQLEQAITHQFRSFNWLRKKFLFDVTHFAIDNPTQVTGHLNSEQLAVLEARNEIINETKTKLNATCQSFLIEAKQELRRRFAKAFEQLLTAVKTGKFNQKSINSVLRLIDDFSALNVTEDEHVEEWIGQWKTSLKAQSAQSIKDESTLNAEFTKYIEEQLEKINKLQQEQADEFQENFGEVINRDIDPF